MVTLGEHQKHALRRLRSGSVLKGGVGSGKSITGLCFWMQHFFDKSLYIITTADKRDRHEWDEELAKLEIDRPVVVDSWNNVAKYTSVINAFFIFDEQRAIGYGVWAQSFILIAKLNDWIMLTATPGDTWTDYIPLFIANGFYKNKSEFLDSHVVFSKYSRYPKVEKYLDVATLVDYKNSILVDMDFPRTAVKTVITIPVEFDKAAYNLAIRTRINPKTNSPFTSTSALCYYLRQLVSLDTSRINILRNLTVKHKRIVVFYNFNIELETLREFAEKSNITYAEVNGRFHQSIPETERWLYFVQFKSGSESWNCIQTNVIVYFSDSYSYKQMVQSAGRIDRYTTPFKELYYYRFYAGSSIENAILKALEMKEDFNESEFAKNFPPIMEGEG